MPSRVETELHENDRIGFGLRDEGYDDTDKTSFVYRLKKAEIYELLEESDSETDEVDMSSAMVDEVSSTSDAIISQCLEEGEKFPATIIEDNVPEENEDNANPVNEKLPSVQEKCTNEGSGTRDTEPEDLVTSATSHSKHAALSREEFQKKQQKIRHWNQPTAQLIPPMDPPLNRKKGRMRRGGVEISTIPFVVQQIPVSVPKKRGRPKKTILEKYKKQVVLQNPAALRKPGKKRGRPSMQEKLKQVALNQLPQPESSTGSSKPGALKVKISKTRGAYLAEPVESLRKPK